MQSFFEEHKKKIIAAGLLVLVLIVVITSGKKLNATILESAVGVVVTPFQDLTTGISSWVDETVTASRNNTDLKKENTELKNQTVEYPKLSEEEIKQIIKEKYFDKIMAHIKEQAN